MSLLHIIVLALVQGIAELLPISSSAHVIAVEKLLGLDPTAPEMTFLLVMLHTGTMFAVIGYFWKTWRERYFASMRSFMHILRLLIIATLMTGVIGGMLLLLIEKVVLGGSPNAEIEQIFGNAYVMAGGLAAAGILIIVSGLRPGRERPLAARESAWIGAVQGLCLPFRGFSRSGSTISTGLLAGVDRFRAEEFSFALAVILTPPVIAKEAWRLFKSQGSEVAASHGLLATLAPGLFGMVCSFGAGWLALRWLSRWLEQGRWHYFGIYCLVASLAVLVFLR
jgi:undecaprenyl-diphosphatase